MELDPIDPIAVAIVRLELRSETVGQAGEFLNVLVAGHGTERGASGRRPGSLAIDGGAQHHIAGEGVERACRLRLVENPMGAETIGGGFEDGWGKRLVHDRLPGYRSPQIASEFDLPCLSRARVARWTQRPGIGPFWSVGLETATRR